MVHSIGGWRKTDGARGPGISTACGFKPGWKLSEHGKSPRAGLAVLFPKYSGSSSGKVSRSLARRDMVTKQTTPLNEGFGEKARREYAIYARQSGHCHRNAFGEGRPSP